MCLNMHSCSSLLSENETLDAHDSTRLKLILRNNGEATRTLFHGSAMARPQGRCFVYLVILIDLDALIFRMLQKGCSVTQVFEFTV